MTAKRQFKEARNSADGVHEAPNEFDDDEGDRRQPFYESRSAITGYWNNNLQRDTGS
jgi:hypothetical protein